jgi:nucleoside-diphosphate-sugar epimerase
MRALVTGGQGFVGSHLCARLVTEGHRVRVLARTSSDLGNLAGVDVEVVRGDVTRPESLGSAVAGCDVIFHVAGALKGLRERDLFHVNADGTRNLVAAAAGAQPRPSRFVYISSLAAAGPSPGGEAPRTEAMPLQPLTWYGHSKLAGENAVRAAVGLDWTIVRPPIVFGPRERDVLGYFRIARRGFLPVVGFSDRYYSLIYVGDLVDGLVRAAAAPAAVGQVYFLAGPEVVSWVELGQLIASALGVAGRPLRLPELVAAAAGRLADLYARARGRPEIFSSQKVIEMLAPAWVCSADKAARDFGWRASTPLPDALATTARWYREHGWL